MPLEEKTRFILISASVGPCFNTPLIMAPTFLYSTAQHDGPWRKLQRVEMPIPRFLTNIHELEFLAAPRCRPECASPYDGFATN